MGFGTLFVGYFLLLNVTFYGYTDLISALIMAMGLYRLASVNRDFRLGYYSSLVFSGYGLIELIKEFLVMFSPSLDTRLAGILPYASILRYALIFVLTVFILRGIASVAKEVGIGELSARANLFVPISAIVYAFAAALEIPPLSSIFPLQVLAVSAFVILILSFCLVIFNLITIYTAYMRICMPGDEDMDTEEKPSRFEFINKYRKRKAEKEHEYAEYQRQRLKEKAEKKSKNTKKKK